MSTYATPYDVRLACRENRADGFPSRLLPGYLCVNVVMLEAQFAADFEAFCRANPRPCPLAAALRPGETGCPDYGEDIDVRTDLGYYDIYREGNRVDTVRDVVDLFSDSMVTFLIGSSVSFDGVLAGKGMESSCGIRAYNTQIDCNPVGVFSGKMVVTMRTYEPEIADRVADYTSHLPACHGAPIGRNNAEELGITPTEFSSRELEPPPRGHDQLFWACGITPHLVAQEAKLPLMVIYKPGYAMITDVPTESLFVE